MTTAPTVSTVINPQLANGGNQSKGIETFWVKSPNENLPNATTVMTGVKRLASSPLDANGPWKMPCVLAQNPANANSTDNGANRRFIDIKTNDVQATQGESLKCDRFFTH